MEYDHIAKEAIEIRGKIELERVMKIASDKILETFCLEEKALSMLRNSIE